MVMLALRLFASASCSAVSAEEHKETWENPLGSPWVQHSPKIRPEIRLRIRGPILASLSAPLARSKRVRDLEYSVSNAKLLSDPRSDPCEISDSDRDSGVSPHSPWDPALPARAATIKNADLLDRLSLSKKRRVRASGRECCECCVCCVWV
jgi:hypothetical protein